MQELPPGSEPPADADPKSDEQFPLDSDTIPMDPNVKAETQSVASPRASEPESSPKSVKKGKILFSKKTPAKRGRKKKEDVEEGSSGVEGEGNEDGHSRPSSKEAEKSAKARKSIGKSVENVV